MLRVLLGTRVAPALREASATAVERIANVGHKKTAPLSLTGRLYKIKTLLIRVSHHLRQ